MNPQLYASLLRLAVLGFGTGSLAFTAADTNRIEFLLSTCTVTYDAPVTVYQGGRRWSVQWNGCQQLAKELATAGALICLALIPPPSKDDDGQGRA